MAKSEIEWTDFTFNPWWGCTKVSDGCTNCYAETWSKRTGHKVWGPNQGRRFFGDNHWKQPLRWNAKAEREGTRLKVFCASMADVFEDFPGLAPYRGALFDLIENTPYLDWQLLTKRPENVLKMVPLAWVGSEASVCGWPVNAWIGTSAEDQATYDDRLVHLVDIPAYFRFLSLEPLLGPIDLNLGNTRTLGIHWVIAGGESGSKARSMHLDWARGIRNQCRVAGVPFFFKQWGERHQLGRRVGKKAAGRLLDGREWNEYPNV